MILGSVPLVLIVATPPLANVKVIIWLLLLVGKTCKQHQKSDKKIEIHYDYSSNQSEDAYSLVVWLVAVISSGEVSHCSHSKASTLLRVGILPAVVSKTFKQLLNGFLVVTDEIGILGYVVAVPENKQCENINCRKNYCNWIEVCLRDVTYSS